MPSCIRRRWSRRGCISSEGLYPLFLPEVLIVIAYVGAITLVYGATCAVVQTDLKKILAYSTISQLGYMMLAMGVGGREAGLFHLVTHAFFKSLLFLAAGSVIVACHHVQDVARLGGLAETHADHGVHEPRRRDRDQRVSRCR